MRYHLCVVLFCLFFFLPQSYAQLSNDEKINEVYGASFFDDKPDLKATFHKLLDERIRYVHEPVNPNGEKYPLLSHQGLLGKNNPGLTVHAGFDAATFNPLRYNLTFFGNTTQVYRIDGSEYLLVIEPQIKQQ